MILWKGKKVIVAITVLFALLTGIFTMFFIEPVYESKLDLIVNFPETVNTKYGEYKLLMTTNEQYINLIQSNDVLKLTMNEMNYDLNKSSIEKFSSRISIHKDDKKPNSFTIKVQASSPDEALQTANILFKNYIGFLNTTVKTRSADYFINYYTTDIRANKDNLDLNNKLLTQYKDMLAKIPQTINQKDVLSSVNTDSIDYIVLENIINENYTKVELDIINIEQAIYNLENKVKLDEQYLDELNEIKASIDENGELASEYFKIVDTSIYLPSEPIAPSHKTSPSTLLNTVIGAVIGGMLSVVYILIKKYWFTEVNN